MDWIEGVLVSPGEPGVYGERTLQGYRVWDPYRSKLAAVYHLGHGVELESTMRVLYLGAAHGTTVSHVSDYVECVYAVEFAPNPMQDLLMVAQKRRNIIPVMADASHPEEYAALVESVDLVYQDVAQAEQAEIAIKNAFFLRNGGKFILILKTRSMDVRRDPKEVRNEASRKLVDAGFFSLESAFWLAPYHQDHAVLVYSVNRE
jgi:fibrillarin-like pre-rRNA processing protein